MQKFLYLLKKLNLFKNLCTKKTSGADDFTGKLYQTFKEEITSIESVGSHLLVKFRTHSWFKINKKQKENTHISLETRNITIQNLIKRIYQKSTTNIKLNGEIFFPQDRKWCQVSLLLSLLINTVLEVQCCNGIIRKGKKNVLFAENIIVYLNNPKEFTDKLLELIL